MTDKSETTPDIMADLCDESVMCHRPWTCSESICRCELIERAVTEIKRLRGLLQGLLDYIDLVDPVISKAPPSAPGDDERIIAAQEALKL